MQSNWLVSIISIKRLRETIFLSFKQVIKSMNSMNFCAKTAMSVIRRKGESQNECFKKTKHAKFYEKQTFYQGVRNVSSSENFACFVFLKHSFWDSPFYLITDAFSLWTQYVPHDELQDNVDRMNPLREKNWKRVWYHIKSDKRLQN